MTPSELAADMVAKGAKVIIFNSDDQKDHAIKFAQENPDVYVIHASGDTAWKEGKNYIEIPNLKNIMGRMEYGKMIAGCAAALTSQTGKIGFLGPLINDETRRFAASSYLGARNGSASGSTSLVLRLTQRRWLTISTIMATM